ncbi:MAG: TolB family protein, partial [Dehalococcoidia bacterium]
MTSHSSPLLTAADIVGMWQPLDPRVSPDGHLVAFTVQALSKPKGQKRPRAAVWVASADGAYPVRCWTRAESHDRFARWSPDGRWLAFLSDRDEEGQDQICRIAASGGEAERLTNWRGGVSAFVWSPDGRRIAFTAADEQVEEHRKQRDESGDDTDVWGEGLAYDRLRLVAADGGDSIPLTPADKHVTGFAWSPAGDEIAVALAVRPDLDAPAEAGIDLVRYPVDGSAAAIACHVPFGADQLTWAGDGSVILFVAWEALAIPSSRAIFAVDAAGGAPRCLTRGLHGCVTGLTRAARSRSALCLVAEGLTTRLYELDIAGGRLRPLQLPADRTAASGLPGADDSGSVVATICSNGQEPPEVWISDAAGHRQVSDCN